MKITPELQESLLTLIPVLMDNLDHQAHQMGGDYTENVLNLARYLPDNSPSGSRTTAMALATTGDSLFGESKPGRAATTHYTLALAIAALALTNPNGVTKLGIHVCNPNGCTCKPTLT